MIFEHPGSSWEPKQAVPGEAVRQLESGGVLRFPKLAFELNQAEIGLLDPKILSGSRKNASYDLARDRLAGVADGDPRQADLRGLIRRYAVQSRALIDALLPNYGPSLIQGRTSFRPAEIAGRASSVKKDDTRLHVDAFPATPLQGQRILRVFTNLNRDGKSRHWRVGESFTDVAQRFAPGLALHSAALRKLMQALRITKSYRTAYDELMLGIHDGMKMDDAYQASVKYQDVHFQPGETWVVYSDQVSHAAMGGQHLMEQTFYLPVNAMSDEKQSPLRILERIRRQPLLT